MSKNKEEYKLLLSLIFEKYGKIVLNTKETAEILGVSSAALRSDRQEAIGIPFTRRNYKEKGQPLYNITSIVNHLLDNEIKTII